MIQGKKPLNITMLMEVLSREYGWTPNQIREQPFEDIQEYVAIIRTRRYLEKKEADKIKRK